MLSPSVRHSPLLAAVLAIAAPLAAQPTPPAAPGPATPAQATEPAPAGAKPVEKRRYEKVEISGLLFGDGYAVLAHHDPDVDGQWGFWLRRGALTFDAALAGTWSARFRLEVDSPRTSRAGRRRLPSSRTRT